MSNRRNKTKETLIAVFATLAVLPGLACVARPAAAGESIGGIRFQPPQPARIRLASGYYSRGEVMAVSKKTVQFRLKTGKVVDYEFRKVRSLVTLDGAIKYTSAHDSYDDIVTEAKGLDGVAIDGRTETAGTGDGALDLPRPPAPQHPIMLDSPDQYEVAPRVAAATPTSSRPPAVIPPIPPASAPSAPTAQAGATDPFYETGAFKVGFLVACLAVILLWWRTKVG